MSYQIGEVVRVKDINELAYAESKLFNSKSSRRSGMTGTIVDRLYSEANECYVYSIMFDGDATTSRCRFTDDELEYPYSVEALEFRIHRNGKRMEAFLCKEDGTVIECGYGVILYDNPVGITQAATHAMKSMYKKLKGDN